MNILEQGMQYLQGFDSEIAALLEQEYDRQ